MSEQHVEQLTPFEEVAQARRILLYPAGTGASYFHEFLSKRHPEVLPRIVGLGDRDPNKQGKNQLGLIVHAPEDLAGLNPDLVVVTSLRYPAIRKALEPLLPEGTPFVHANVVDEFMDYEAESSALAAWVSREKPDTSKLLAHRGWFTCLPAGPRVFSQSLKKSYTFRLLKDIDLPDDMSGQRVLDLGGNDGFYSFECLARGASEAVTVESIAWDTESGMQRYNAALASYGLNARPVHADVERLNPEELGTFDTVLCLGLYYHLKNPMALFEKLAALTTDTVILSGRAAAQPVADYFMAESGGGVRDASYFVRTSSEPKWLANTSCLRDMFGYSGFSTVELISYLCPLGSQIASVVVRARK